MEMEGGSEADHSDSGKSSDESDEGTPTTLEVRDASNKHKKSKHKKKSKRKSKRSKRKHRHRSRSGSKQRKSRSKSKSAERKSRSEEREEKERNESTTNERKRSVDREKDKSEQSKSKSRKRSLGRSRSRSRQREREKEKDNTRSRNERPRSRDNSQSRKSRRRTPSKERSVVKRRSRSRSHDRSRYDSVRSRPASRRQGSPRRGYGRSRSRSYDRRRYDTHRRRSRSRSYQRQSNYRRRSRSRSPRQSRDDDRRRHSRSRSVQHVAASVPINLTVALSSSTTTTTTITSAKPTEPKSSIADFTALCKKLTETDENGDFVNETVEHNTMLHPFKVKPAKDIVISPVILPVIVPKPSFDPTKPLEQTFPVSRGSQHKSKEDSKSAVVEDVDGSVEAAEQVFQNTIQQEKLDVGGLIAKRLAAQGRLLSNPNDVEAKLILEEVQMKIQNWAAVNLKPGQFTGENLGQMMSKEGINSGYQAWVRKDMFHKLNPIRGGIGMMLLTKMGWKPGQVLGKRGEGKLEPIALDVKTDRKGLISSLETQKGGKGSKNKAIVNQAVQGKHPVSALAEHCTKMKWNAPVYNVVHESGPSHKKDFLYSVIVDGYSYQYNIASNNKKLAKAQAAFCALKNLGVLPADAKM